MSNEMAEIEDCNPESLPDYISGRETPVILRGLISQWPMVNAAKQSGSTADLYLRQFYRQAVVTAFTAPAQASGRIFYNDDLSGFNFERKRTTLDTILDSIQQHSTDTSPPTYYVGSTSVNHCLPGFKADNDLGLDHLNPVHNIWIGNQLSVAAHFDTLNNIACNAAGRRRFTLFAPNQVDNLYIGPLDFTPSGQPISLVDFAQPDFEKYPRFEQAMENALTAELGPGDAIFIPAMWWHHVQSLERLNVLVNYWWRQVPAFVGSPMDALNHALLSIGDLPASQKAHWQQLFDHYIFNADEQTHTHIPPQRRGPLDTLDEMSARKLRGMLLNKLNR